MRKHQTDRFWKSELSSLEKFKNKLIFAQFLSLPLPAGPLTLDLRMKRWVVYHCANAPGHKQAHHLKLSQDSAMKRAAMLSKKCLRNILWLFLRLKGIGVFLWKGGFNKNTKCLSISRHFYLIMIIRIPLGVLRMPTYFKN